MGFKDSGDGRIVVPHWLGTLVFVLLGGSNLEISLSISFNLAENISLLFIWYWKVGDSGLGYNVDPNILGIEYAFTAPVNPSLPLGVWIWKGFCIEFLPDFLTLHIRLCNCRRRWCYLHHRRTHHSYTWWLSASQEPIYIYIKAEAERKWVPKIKEVMTNRKSPYLKFKHV